MPNFLNMISGDPLTKLYKAVKVSLFVKNVVLVMINRLSLNAQNARSEANATFSVIAYVARDVLNSMPRCGTIENYIIFSQ